MFTRYLQQLVFIVYIREPDLFINKTLTNGSGEFTRKSSVIERRWC